MLGLILLYAIGKYFYELADEYQKNKWGFVALGIATYYLAAVVLGILLGIILSALGLLDLEETSDLLLDLMIIPLGVISVLGLYYFLKRRWENERESLANSVENRISQIGQEEEDDLFMSN